MGKQTKVQNVPSPHINYSILLTIELSPVKKSFDLQTRSYMFELLCHHSCVCERNSPLYNLDTIACAKKTKTNYSILLFTIFSDMQSQYMTKVNISHLLPTQKREHC